LPEPSEDTPNDETAARISEYSGLLVAAFPLAQFCVSLPWGRVSDLYGRRVSILGGLLVSVIANIGFGLSRSLGALLFWRLAAGLANGNVAIMRTVTAEVVCARRFQTKAFLLLPLVFNSGMVASLALGGFLAEPADNLPGLFGPDGLFNTGGYPEGVRWALAYPYALPALLNATLLVSALLLAVLGLRETLPGREDQSDWGIKAGQALVRYMRRVWPSKTTSGDYVVIENFDQRVPDDSNLLDSGLADHDTSQIPAEKPALRLPFRAIWTRKVLCAMVSFGLLPLHNSAFMHIFPVYLSSPPAENSEATFFAFTGGLGLRSATIGIWLSAFGVGGILLQLFIYPIMQARVGTRGVFRIALIVFPVTYALAPYLSLVVGNHEMRWVFLGTVVCSQIMARTMAIPSTVILLTEASPQKSVLGTVHGAGNMLASFARAVGPALGGYVFALGVEEGIVGLVWWLYLVIIALSALAWSYIMDIE
jgi:MFS family permease